MNFLCKQLKGKIKQKKFSFQIVLKYLYILQETIAL